LSARGVDIGGATSSENGRGSISELLKKQEDARQELQRDLELKDLEPEAKVTYVPLALNSRPTYSTEGMGSQSLTGFEDTSFKANHTCANVFRSEAEKMKERKFTCSTDSIDQNINFTVLMSITSKARGDAQAAKAGAQLLSSRRDDSGASSRQLENRLKIFSSAEIGQDEEIPQTHLDIIRNFTNHVNGFLRFYWTLFPPKNMKEFAKMQKIRGKLDQAYTKLITYRRNVLAKGHGALYLLVAPLLKSLKKLFETQAQVKERIDRKRKRI